MAYNKVHFHGIGTGIGDHVRRCDEAGIPVSTVSVNNAGWVVEVAQRRQQSLVPHQIVLRYDKPGGRNDDHPDNELLDSDPKAASDELYPHVKASLDSAPELVPFKGDFYNQPTNEVSTQDHDPSNVGHFLTELAIRLNADGYRAAIGGFNAGQPQPEDWHTEGMVRLLRYLEANPQNVIAVHEGKTNGDINDPIAGFVPDMVGRFGYIFDACDELGIARPKVIVTEWAWANNDMPALDAAMSDVRWLAEFLAQYPEVLGACLWNLEQGQAWGNLPDKLQKLIAPVTEYTLATTFPDPVDEPDEPTETVPEFIWRRAEELAPTNTEAALQRALMDTTRFKPYGPERWQEYEDGTLYALQPAIDWDTLERATAYAEVPHWHDVRIIVGPDGEGPDADEASVSLPVPYLSQWTPSADLSSGDCGPACVAMLANYYGHTATVNEAAAACGQPPDSKSASINQLIQGLNHYGVANNYRRPVTLSWLREQLDVGHPAILLLHYGAIPDRQDVAFTGGHFFVAVGYGSDDEGDYFLVNDSNFWGNRINEGDHRRVAAADLDAAMEQATLDDNWARQGIVTTGAVEEPQGRLIDLTRFKVAHPDAWRVVKHVDSEGHETNEDVQDLQLGDGLFVRRKNRNAEWHRLHDGHFWLVHDTSPSPSSEGVPRVYTLTKDGLPGAPKSKAQQRVGETWREDGQHLVQFRTRDGCRKLTENSGLAQNSSVITRYEENYTFNRFGQSIAVDEAVWEKTGVEEQVYARKDGKSLGWCGWSAPWGVAEIVEIHWDRDRLTQEPDRVCDWA